MTREGLAGVPDLSEAGRCSLCRRPVQPGEPTALDTDGVIHLACQAAVAQASRKVADVLRAQIPARMCHACLSAQLGLPHGLVRKATIRLGAMPSFRLKLAKCTACGVVHVTARAQSRAVLPRFARGGSGLVSALQRFALQVRGRICLAVVRGRRGEGIGTVMNGLLERRVVRVYVMDLEGVREQDVWVAQHPRVAVVSPATWSTLPERPSVAVIALPLDDVEDVLPCVLNLVEPDGDVIVQVAFTASADVADWCSGESDLVQRRTAVLHVTTVAAAQAWCVLSTTMSQAQHDTRTELFLHLRARGAAGPVRS